MCGCMAHIWWSGSTFHLSHFCCCSFPFYTFQENVLDEWLLCMVYTQYIILKLSLFNLSHRFFTLTHGLCFLGTDTYEWSNIGWCEVYYKLIFHLIRFYRLCLFFLSFNIHSVLVLFVYWCGWTKFTQSLHTLWFLWTFLWSILKPPYRFRISLLFQIHIWAIFCFSPQE